MTTEQQKTGFQLKIHPMKISIDVSDLVLRFYHLKMRSSFFNFEVLRLVIHCRWWNWRHKVGAVGATVDGWNSANHLGSIKPVNNERKYQAQLVSRICEPSTVCLLVQSNDPLDIFIWYVVDEKHPGLIKIWIFKLLHNKFSSLLVEIQILSY